MSRCGVSAQEDKAGWTGSRSAAETWAEFDCLPTGVKRLFWDAPYNYTAADAFAAYRDGSVTNWRAMVARQRSAMAEDVEQEALRLYGPDHPQA